MPYLLTTMITIVLSLWCFFVVNIVNIMALYHEQMKEFEDIIDTYLFDFCIC